MALARMSDRGVKSAEIAACAAMIVARDHGRPRTAASVAVARLGVPAEVSHTAERQAKLDDAYKDAVARQGEMKFSADPAFVRKLAEDYVRSNALIHVGRDQVRARFASSPVLARLATLRHVLRRRLS